MSDDPRRRRADRHAPPAADSRLSSRKQPITVDRITDAALDIVAEQGYDALTMRNVATRLNTGAASLYAHVVNKADIDELIIGRLCNRLVLPTPNPELWRAQIVDVCTQLRDLYLQYPGISRAALAMVVTDLDVLRVNEGMLSILLESGIDPQTAAWAIDALFLYVGAYTLEIALASQRHGRHDEDWTVSRDERDELMRRFSALPVDEFPNVQRYAVEVTAGLEHERFDFTLALMLDNLESRRTTT